MKTVAGWVRPAPALHLYLFSSATEELLVTGKLGHNGQKNDGDP